MRIYTFKDRTGDRYGSLLVLSQVETPKRQNKKWLCLCDCGTKKVFSISHLRDGSTSSCGCEKNEKLRASSTKHGYSKNKEYRSEYNVWVGIKRRCSDPSTTHYKNYGARGVTVCERWLGADGFPNFISDMGKKPTPRHSLDRHPDNNGNYSPENCKWSTMLEQNRNKRDCHYLEYDGRKMVLLDWANELNVARFFIYSNLKTMPFDKVVELIKSGNYRKRKRRTSKTISI